MGKTIGLRPKLLLLLSFPLIGLAFLTFHIASGRWAIVEESTNLVSLVQLSVRIGDLLHETQKERGSSSLFMSSQGTKFGDTLVTQRQLTDRKLDELRRFSGSHSAGMPSEIREQLAKVGSTLGDLSARRESVSTISVKPKEIIDWYTQLNAQLLDSIESIASHGSNAELGRLSMAYLAFLRAKEATGIERAQMSNVFATNQFGPGQAFLVAGLMSAQKAYLQVFASVAGSTIVEMYRTRMAAPVVAEVSAMEQVARDKATTGDFGVEPTAWFAAMTKKIDLLKEVENGLSTAIVDRASALADEAYGALRTTVGGLVALFAVVLGLALVLARNIVKPVRELTQIADRVSMGDIKQDVEVEASGEIRDLATSFKRMVNAFKIMDSMMNVEPLEQGE